MTKLKNVSASQVNTYNRCARKWHWERIGGHREPSTNSQRRGTAIHHALELYLKTGDVVGSVEVNEETGNITGLYPGKAIGDNWHETKRYVETAKKFLPEPCSDVLLEEKIVLATFDGGPPWLGFVDLIEETPRITDYKTTSDIRRYAKKPAELLDDVQAIAYAKFVFENDPDLQEVEARWLYFETRNKIKVNTLEVPQTLTRDRVEVGWDILMADVAAMVESAKVPDSLEIEPNTEACSDYGGCPHVARCGLTALGEAFGKSTKKQKGNTMGFLDKIKKQISTQSIVPPDAPPATTSDEDAEAATPKKDKPKTEKKTRGRPKGAKNKTHGSGFALFIDCMPVKGGEPYMVFENWIAPIVAAMNTECEKTTGKPNFWLLPFGDQKAAIATAIGLSVGTIATNLVVMSSDPYARDVVPLLVPHANMVVRSLRG